MTERLYYNDPYLTQFTAEIVETAGAGCAVYLDRTAFYPTSGGQPYDLGTLNGIPVTDVADQEDRICHILATPLAEGNVQGSIDWPRRHDHMQQHTGQHLLSAVLEELYGIPTISFHLGQEISTIDLGVPTLSPDQVTQAERRVNEIVWESRPVIVSYEDSRHAQGLRKASERDGILRIVTIADLDRSACGGTHVRSTSGIGVVQIRRLDRIRGNVRLEFLCGARAIARARRDYETLNEVAKVFSASLEQVPEIAAQTIEKAAELEKARRKLALELAGVEGKRLYENTAPDAHGMRLVVRKEAAASLDEELRAVVQQFIMGERAVFLASFPSPPTVLLAASKDSGFHAGDLIRKSLAAVGGRGGGNAQLAQGSVPSVEALQQTMALIQTALD